MMMVSEKVSSTIILILNYIFSAVARIGFENITYSVEEEAGFANLSVALLGNVTLGGRVTVRFSTSDLSSIGQQHHCTCVSMCFNEISPTII